MNKNFILEIYLVYLRKTLKRLQSKICNKFKVDLFKVLIFYIFVKIIKTRTKVVHKSVSQGYNKVQFHIMNLRLHNLNIPLFFFIKIGKNKLQNLLGQTS